MEFHEKKTRNFAIFNLLLIVGTYLDVGLVNIKIPFLEYDVNTNNAAKLELIIACLFLYSFMRYVQESLEEMNKKEQRDAKKVIVGSIGRAYVNFRNRNLDKQARSNNQIAKVEFAIDGNNQLKEKASTYYNRLSLPPNNIPKKSINLNGSDWFTIENPPLCKLPLPYNILTKLVIHMAYLIKNTKAFDHFLPLVLLLINLLLFFYK